ncbi:VTT domain-containing protein [Pontibacter sp. KCTC 32443]|uniref:DedA family protein n=1 Tax=Pontibacter TaxID=323449 RepID=UPI00164E1321|nr:MULTISPECIES: VTT domain-containing protein [Pontibacter]MBC5773710.1 VTT domain-containing protein [Pontibacter sp. KCTC 32443]
MDTTSIIEWGGFLIIAILIFAETGLLIGLVIPGGETLVFTAGLLVSTDSLGVSVAILLFSLILAGIVGDTSGYFIGKKFGRKLYDKEDTWYFKKKYLHMAADYFDKHRKAAIIFGKYLPIIRPFSPVISGTTNMKFSVFMFLTIVASILYMSTYVLAGYFLGTQFPIIKEYLGWIVPISIVVALIPVFKQFRKAKSNA